jgi:hypothetical protein
MNKSLPREATMARAGSPLIDGKTRLRLQFAPD